MDQLPINPLLAQICRTLKSERRLVLAAPPGAGKTTRVPLALAGLIEGFDGLPGRIVMLEPRRIAARMAAERMAATLGEKTGQRVGLSTRVDRKVSDQTRIEVVTDGLFTRRLLSDPDLSGISAVIFDEIHERSLSADLGLAMSLEVQEALRDDLHLLAMSATLDTASLAEKLASPMIESGGRQYPVETRYLGRTRDRLEDQMAKAIQKAHREIDGSILAFLPGAGEIRRTAERLEGLPSLAQTIIAPLYGALSPRDQDLAVSPAPDGFRKIVLATDIAESALTIEGVSVVVDGGMARRPETDSRSGFSRLVTVRASRANVDQRRGRAGRLGPGICYRLWDEAETRGLTAAPTPEILTADLSGLVMTLADWGESQPERLTWLDTPPAGKLKAARARLRELGALTPEGLLSAKGKQMAKLPLSPDYAALVVSADTPGEKALAAQIAALSSERGIGGQSADLAERLARFQRENSPRAKTLRRQAERWSSGAPVQGDAGEVLAKGWPGRIARRREPGGTSYLMASGRAGEVDPASPLAKSDWLAVADLTGSAKSARITLAAAISEQTALAYGQPEEIETAKFDPGTGRFKARRVKRLGEIILSETPLPQPSSAAARAAFLEHLRLEGFAPTGLDRVVKTFLARLTCLRGAFPGDWPEFSEEGLQDEVEGWLGPALGGGRFILPSPASVRDALKAKLDWPCPRDLDRHAPLSVKLPSGRQAEVDWLGERSPLIECRVQELYGARQHLTVADGRVPVTVQMLSPGGKPVATTQDLLGFWGAGYLDMAKDMRGRYPKHDWPDDPASAAPHEGITKARLKNR
ncbi:MAG: ATP-dependent helicase HrpB [Henriciella sp.]